jgi:hypothetical protein
MHFKTIARPLAVLAFGASTTAGLFVATSLPASAAAPSYEVCQRTFPSGALMESHLDCGGAHSTDRVADYIEVNASGDGSTHSSYIWRDLGPSNSSTGYAWTSLVGRITPNQDEIYSKWTLISDGSVRCWDFHRRPGYMVEVDPSLCPMDLQP